MQATLNSTTHKTLAVPMTPISLKRQGYSCSVLVGGVLKIETPKNATYYTDLERGTCTCPAYQFGRGQACKHLAGAAALALSCLCETRTERKLGFMDFRRLCRLTRYAWNRYMDIYGRSSTTARRIEIMRRYDRLQAAVCSLTGMSDWDCRRELLDNWQGMGQAKLSEAFNAMQSEAAKELVN